MEFLMEVGAMAAAAAGAVSGVPASTTVSLAGIPWVVSAMRMALQLLIATAQDSQDPSTIKRRHCLSKAILMGSAVLVGLHFVGAFGLGFAASPDARARTMIILFALAGTNLVILADGWAGHETVTAVRSAQQTRAPPAKTVEFDDLGSSPRSSSPQDSTYRFGATCVICLDECVVGQSRGPNSVMRLPCGHVFHAACLRAWFTCSTRPRCPTCSWMPPVAQPVNSSVLSFLSPTRLARSPLRAAENEDMNYDREAQRPWQPRQNEQYIPRVSQRGVGASINRTLWPATSPNYESPGRIPAML